MSEWATVSIEKLRAIEWSGWVNDGWEDVAYACPVCGGLRPGQDLMSEATAEDNRLGHAEKCWLSELVNDARP